MFIQINNIAALVPSINFATRAIAHILETKSDLPKEKKIVRWGHVGKVIQVGTSDDYLETTMDFRGWGMRVKVLVEVVGSHLITQHHLKSVVVEDVDWVCTRKWGPHAFTAEEIEQMKMVTIQP